MNYASYLWFMGAGTLLAWGAWAAVIFQVNPDEAGILGIVLFYLTLAISLVGSFSIMGVAYRVHALKRTHVVSREVRIAFRHAVLLSAVAIASLILSTTSWLRWWTFLILIASVGIIEYIALLIQETRRT